MPEITRRRAGELVRGVFQVLMRAPDAIPAREVIRRLESLVPPTQFELSSYPNNPNSRRYDKIVRFSTITAVKAGWLVKSKGSWSLTDAGREAFNRYPDPDAFSREAQRLYRQWQAQQPPSESEEVSDEVEQAAATLEEAEEAAWTEIESYLEQMPPYDFQDLVAGLLQGMGYFVEWISPPGPDRGLDIIAHTDPLGLKGPRIKAQVKRRADRLPVDDIRGFMALLGDTDAGIFVSTGGFTRDAMEEARRQEKRRLMLIDLERLVDLWTANYDRIPEAQRRLLPLRAVHYLALEE